MIKSLSPSPLALGPSLRKYFRSGWAFLIPYLAAYLLYWWLRWPVNPIASEGGVKVASESGPLAPHASHLTPPALLHVYWALHAVNAMLAATALVAWLRGRKREIAQGQAPTGDLPPAPDTGEGQCLVPSAKSQVAHQGGSPSPSLSLSLKIAPWLLLGLLFLIPGVYLEYPADPWGHYGRVNEWSRLHLVSEHNAWNKSSYCLAYSILGQITPPTRQLFWLDFYYTGCCLLLCWQYYRLARAVGLGERASFIFVLIQALTFGNNIFGFYRYYGISSSIFAQLGAVALIRIAIEFARGEWRPGTGDWKESPASRTWLILSAVLLAGLIGFNHVQGLGIAGLGLAAVVIWRLIGWRRSMVFWIAAAAVALSVAAILWWPRHPALDAVYRPAGWLTAWYGFNVLSPRSLAGDRTMAMLGFFGIVNLIAGLFLLRRNHVAAWLTITPLFALCLPFITIPFANAIAQHSVPEIFAFHRMLLAIPAGLAIVSLGAEIANRKAQVPGPMFQAASLASGTSEQPSAFSLPIFSLLLLSLAALLLVPASGSYYNRLYNALMIPPGDLRMAPVVAALDDLALRTPQASTRFQMLTTFGHGLVAYAMGIKNVSWAARLTGAGAASRTVWLLENYLAASANQKAAALLLVPPTEALQSPLSLSGYLSGHWPPQEAILECAAGPEIEAAARKFGGTEIKTEAGTYYSFGDWRAVTGHDR